MEKFKYFGLGTLFLVVSAFIIIIFFTGLSGIGETQKNYEKLEEQYYELESKYEETNRILEHVYDDISDTMDSMYLLYDYFEEQSITFDEAYDAYDTLSDIIHSYY